MNPLLLSLVKKMPVIGDMFSAFEKKPMSNNGRGQQRDRPPARGPPTRGNPGPGSRYPKRQQQQYNQDQGQQPLF